MESNGEGNEVEREEKNTDLEKKKEEFDFLLSYLQMREENQVGRKIRKECRKEEFQIENGGEGMMLVNES